MRFRSLTFLTFVLLSGTVVLAQTNPAARPIPFVEPFPSGSFNTYATGFQGWNGLSGATITTQPLAEASAPTGNATLTASNPTSTSTAGLYGSNGRVVLRSGSDATNGVNQLLVAINTTGQTGVRLGYSVTSVLAGPVTMGVVCQFRVGTVGGWTTLTPFAGSAPYVQTGGFTGLKTVVGITLPAACNNQSVVQVRWAVWRGTQTGNSAAFGIDDVAVTLVANDECTGALSLALQDPSGCPANAVAGTTVGSTDSGADCNGTTVDVWYTLTTDNGGGATIQLTPGTAAGMGLQVSSDCGSFALYCQTGNTHAITLGALNTYRLKVFSQTPGTFSICAVRPPGNNTVFFPTPLTSVAHPDDCNATAGTTEWATNDGAVCGAVTNAPDVWYAVDGGAGSAVTIKLTPGTAANMGVQVFSDNGSTQTYCGLGSAHSFQAFGTSYRVKVFAGVPGTFTICAISAPANNEQSTATPLAIQQPGTCTGLAGSTEFATNSSSNCAHPTARDVWYAVTGDASSTVNITLTPGTAGDMGVQVFNGSSTETYCAAGNDHGFMVPQGSTYTVKVFSALPGSFSICAIAAPSNDEQFNPAVLSLQAAGACTPVQGTTAFATTSAFSTNCAESGSTDVWYAVTGGAGMATTFELSPGTASGLALQVFPQSFGDATYCAQGNTHSFQTLQGTTCLVKVSTQVPGTFTVCAVAAPDNNEQFNALTLPLAQPGACTPLQASTVYATNSAAGCTPGTARDLWYAVTGGPGMAATLEITPGTAQSFHVQVLTSSGGTQTYCAAGISHSFQVPSGSTYLVKVATEVAGTYSLCAIAAPTNNESFSPVALTPVAPGTCSPLAASTLHATALDANCVGTGTRDLWYTVPSVPGQTVTIELVPGTATGLGVQVFENQFGSVGAELYCASGNLHTLNIPVGQSRFVKVITTTPGTFTICAIETVVQCLVNGDCNDNNACTIDACLANTCVTSPLITVDEVFEAPDTTCLNGNIQLGTSVLSRTAVNQYVFSTGTGAALDPMTAATFLLFQLNDDQPTSFPSPIGFAFPFNGTLFDHFSVSPDGWLQLGMGAATPEPLNNVTSAANLPRIYPYWDDLQTGNSVFTSGVRSRLTGSAPDRVLKLQWNVCIPKTNQAPNSALQVWLHENGTIEFRYGAMGSASMTASAGITAGASNFQSLTLATNTASTTVPDNANSGQPASGRFYRFTLPQAAVVSHLWSPPTFLNSTTAAQPVATGINVPSQAYSVQVTSSGGCQATDVFTVHTAPPMTAATINGVPGFCAGGGSTTLTAVPAGGGAPFTYLWSPGGQTTASITVSVGGNYACAVTNPCGTVNTPTVNVVENPRPTASAANNGPICGGDTLRLFGTSDIGDSFQWVGPFAQFTLTQEDPVIPNALGDKEGTYSFTATKAATGCISLPAITVVTVNGVPTVSIPTATPALLCSGTGSQLQVRANATAGFMERSEIPFAPLAVTGTAITNWSNGGDGTANDGFSAPVALPFAFKFDGMPFTQLWVGANGYVTFLDPAALTAAQARTSSNMSSSALPNGLVALCFADLHVVTPAAVKTFTVGSPGSRVFVIDYTNVRFAPNTGSMSGQIHLHETTNMIEVHVGTLNFGSSVANSPNLRYAGVEKLDGSSSSLYAGSQSWRFTPLEYLWNPATFLNDATLSRPLASAVTNTTTYTVTVNNSGCQQTRTVTVTATPPVSAASITGNLGICIGGSTILTAVPNSGLGHTYLWSPGGQTTASIAVNAPGSHGCQVSDACGGSANTGPVNVTQGSLPTATAGSNSPLCAGGPLQLTGSTDIGNAFSWTGPNGFSSSLQSPAIGNITAAGDGTYKFIAMNNGCASVASAMKVLVKPVPGFTAVTATPNTVCPSTPSQLSASAFADRAYVRISEVVTQRTGTGATPTYPAYITAGIDDFVELNNTSGLSADISGWKLAAHVSNGSTPTPSVFTFPPGTVMPPNSALVLGIGGGTSSPANFFYVTGTIANWTSSGPLGVVLKNGLNEVVDAVATGTSFVWHPSTGVVSADWTNTTLVALSGRAGIIRTASTDTDTGSDWVNANGPGPLQSIGTFNAGYSNPYLSTVSGYSWSPATFLNNTTIPNPVANGVTATTTYTVTASSGAGCSANGSVTLTSITETCNGVDDDCDGLIDEGCAVLLSMKALLEGPYDGGIGLMTDGLRSLGLLPTAEPYTGLGYAHVGGGGESTTAGVLGVTGNNAIVDWVVVELRSAAGPSTIMATRCALLQRDGDVVAIDGASPVAITISPGNYHVALRHRSHLGCMSATALALSSTTTSVDLTSTATSTFGTNARKSVAGTIAAQVLWAGDVTFNGQVKYTGSGNDRDPILTTVGSTTPNNSVSLYSTRDVNMNGQVKYTGSGNDRDPILVNVGSTTPNNVRMQQLP